MSNAPAHPLRCLPAALALAAAALAAGPVPVPPGDQRAIDEQVWVPFTAALVAHDVDGFFSVHSPEAVRVEGRARRVSDFAAYRATMAAAWRQPPTPGETFELRFTLRLSDGTSAFETGYYRSERVRANGQKSASYGAFAVTLRQEEGRWKILVDADGFDGRTITEELFQAAHPLTTVPRHGPWVGQREPGSRAEIFAPGLVSLPGRREGGATFAPDGRSFYFTFGAADGTFATHVMHWRTDGWSDPVRASFGDQGNTGETFIAPDGSYLLFESDRPGGQGGTDIWVSFRGPDGRWGEPLNLGPDVNSPGVDVAAKVSPDGRFLFFERPTRTEQDIWWASTEVITRLRPANPP